MTQTKSNEETRERPMSTSTIEILLAEDNPGDVILIEEAFKESQSKVKLIVVENGVAAMQYLRKEGEYSNVSKPDLIMLDINLPRKSGLEVLREIRDMSEFKQTPVLILTTSKVGGDIMKAYESGATCFITKPFGFYNFMEAIRSIQHFWFDLVTLPPR